MVSDYWRHIILITIVKASLKEQTIFCLKMRLISYYCIAADADSESVSSDSKPQKEAVNIKELKRVDHILGALGRKVEILFFISYYCSDPSRLG
jgi:hypothetical protein